MRIPWSTAKATAKAARIPWSAPGRNHKSKGKGQGKAKGKVKHKKSKGKSKGKDLAAGKGRDNKGLAAGKGKDLAAGKGKKDKSKSAGLQDGGGVDFEMANGSMVRVSSKLLKRFERIYDAYCIYAVAAKRFKAAEDRLDELDEECDRARSRWKHEQKLHVGVIASLPKDIRAKCRSYVRKHAA